MLCRCHSATTWPDKTTARRGELSITAARRPCNRGRCRTAGWAAAAIRRLAIEGETGGETRGELQLACLLRGNDARRGSGGMCGWVVVSCVGVPATGEEVANGVLGREIEKGGRSVSRFRKEGDGIWIVTSVVN